VRRFPTLEGISRASLGVSPTPVERVRLEGGDPGEPGGSREIWLKRDDLSAPIFGGNKVRALEFLLAGAGPGEEIVTAGGTGSTHALATAIYARALGAQCTIVRWRQEMNATAHRVGRRIDRTATRRIDARTVAGAYARIALLRLRPRVRWIPAGGSRPLGVLGHLNAALELAEQVQAGLLPAPTHVVVPLGTGGTAAGLALGFAAAGLDVTVVGARVVPRIVASARRVHRLAARTARLVERHGGEHIAVAPERLVVRHDVYGGAYGRETAEGRDAAAALGGATGIFLDATYGAKALAAALRLPAGGRPLFWITFDGRWLADADDAPGARRGRR
jgi:1-aminocyclopropane-1-carboxylate deaminase/D-cysteine desulfhydrase-like pyridoxal-dependent ACC family enzyme